MDEFTTHIRSKISWFDFDLKEFWRYRDLIFLFVKRNYNTRYKQTILGPLWLLFNPLITVTLYVLVFGNIAGLATDGSPQFAFYLCSNAIWTYFATCIAETSNTFTANVAILGKVYFPRLVMPVSSVITGFLDLLIQVVMLTVVIIYYICTGTRMHITWALLLAPILVIQTALLGLGCGIIIAACTTKYRDLVVLVSFGIQLWLYVSPVVYTSTAIPPEIYNIYMCNPMAPIITVWRYAVLGTGEFPVMHWGISWIVTLMVLVLGVLFFNKVERTFMDTV